MPASSNDVQDLIKFPRESLAIELKAWLDPQESEGAAKIVRAAIALRNQNGGFLLVGFDNATGAPLIDESPGDQREKFHVDRIQSLITKYASEPFEVFVHLPEHEGVVLPVIEVESGVKSPVAAKGDLRNVAGTFLVKQNRVYVRSLLSNNTPSTTEVTWRDWSRIVEICFDNREADIGRFLRRHLGSLTREVLREVGTALGPSQPLEPSAPDRARDVLERGAARFATRVSQLTTQPSRHGSWEVGLAIAGDIPAHHADQQFLSLLMSANPSYTGWPVWLDSRDSNDSEMRPYVLDGAWEAFILSLDRGSRNHLDFWRLDPRGIFYLYRALQDDFAGHQAAPAPNTLLDFGLVILKVAEAIAVGIEFGKAMGCTRDGTELAFAFRWSGLKGRELASWASWNRHIMPGRRARQDQVVTQTLVPLDTAPAVVSQFVLAAVAPLFHLFDGFIIPPATVEDLTRRLLERRL